MMMMMQTLTLPPRVSFEALGSSGKAWGLSLALILRLHLTLAPAGELPDLLLRPIGPQMGEGLYSLLRPMPPFAVAHYAACRC